MGQERKREGEMDREKMGRRGGFKGDPNSPM